MLLDQKIGRLKVQSCQWTNAFIIAVYFEDKTIVITVKHTDTSSALHMELTSVANRHITNRWAILYTI